MHDWGATALRGTVHACRGMAHGSAPCRIHHEYLIDEVVQVFDLLAVNTCAALNQQGCLGKVQGRPPVKREASAVQMRQIFVKPDDEKEGFTSVQHTDRNAGFKHLLVGNVKIPILGQIPDWLQKMQELAIPKRLGLELKGLVHLSAQIQTTISAQSRAIRLNAVFSMLPLNNFATMVVYDIMAPEPRTNSFRVHGSMQREAFLTA